MDVQLMVWKEESFLSVGISRCITTVFVTVLIESQLISKVVLPTVDADKKSPAGIWLLPALALSRKFDLQLFHTFIAGVSNVIGPVIDVHL